MLCAGHHEAEFGMSWCAGFNGDFWKGYHSILPKEPGGCSHVGTHSDVSCRMCSTLPNA